MERKEKDLEMERQRKGKKKEQEMDLEKFKLKRGKGKGMMIMVGKKAGPSTPSTTWRLEFSSLNNNPIQEFLTTAATVSARKLCANLWELQPHLHFSISTMPNSNVRTPHNNKKKTPLVDPPNFSTLQPATASSLGKDMAQSSMQHRRSFERNVHRRKHTSSASIDSSMEVAPYNPLRTPSSLDLKGKRGESNYSLKTSAELLKVLNRIWSLEEKQSCNMSLLKTMKMELERSQSQIKDLLKENVSNRQEMDGLMKQVNEDKVLKKNKEQDRIKVVIQSARKELEEERKLRKHSESQHRKLARELSRVKSAFSNAIKELERERKARFLLENLCDEFAKGVRDYEQEVRFLRHLTEMDHVDRRKPDSMVLHISEAWLDERMQMRLAGSQNDCLEKNTIVDKLSLDIETFLEARNSNALRKDGSSLNEAINNWSRRESFPLNEATSAPQNVAEDEDSVDSDSHFELNRTSGRRHSISSSKRRGNVYSEGNLKSDSMRRLSGSRGNTRDRRFHARFNLNDIDEVDALIRNHSMSSEGGKIHPEGELKEDLCAEGAFGGQASPVQKWMSKLASPEFDISEPSLKLPEGVKENTLKAKLLEARLEGQKSRSKAGKSLT